MIKLYRQIAMAEGASYLLLLLIAMPLKYIWKIPEPVKYVGWIHGVLFILYAAMLLICAFKYRWKLVRILGFFVASLLPFVPFFVEKQLKKEYGDA